MFRLKTLTVESIPSALQKAERYRLLNEPNEAESICLDILKVAPDNQEALNMLLLAYTDKFKEALYPAFRQAIGVLEQMDSAYCKAYYRGIIFERRAKFHMNQGGPGCGELVHDWCTRAMAEYERAMEAYPSGNQDEVLRWNTCARMLNENPHLQPAAGNREVELIDAYE